MVGKTERNVFHRMLFSLILLIISLVCVGLAYGHWAYTLNLCSSGSGINRKGYNCGCILFGSFFSNGFSGGNVEYCEYVTYVQIPVFLTSAVLTFYHGYRVCIKGKRKVQNAAKRASPLLPAQRRTNESSDKVVVFDSEPPEEPDPPSKKIRILLLVTSLLMVVFLLSSAVIVIAGYFESCRQYRRLVVKELNLSGNAAQVVGSRISCMSIFDFLDYLQPDRLDFDEPLQYIRKDKINTGVTLVIAKTALFMNTMNWIIITYFHIKSLWNCCRTEPVSVQSN